MKKYFALIAGIAAIAVSCGNEKIVWEKTTLKDLDFENGQAAYYGEYISGLHNYTICLTDGEFDEEGYINGDANVLYLDLYASTDSDASNLPEGTYKVVDEDDIAAGTVCAGREQTLREYLQSWIDAGFEIDLSEYTDAELNEGSGNIVGSEYYVQHYVGKDEDGEDSYEYEDFLFTAESGTTVQITKNGVGYKINVDAYIDGKNVTYSFNGKIEIADESEDGGDSGDVDRSSYEVKTVNSFTQAEADYDGLSQGYYWWYLYIADNNINLTDLSGTGKLLCIELATTVSGKTAVPANEYLINADSGDYIAIGYYTYEQDGSTYAGGTNYYEGDDLIVGADDGFVRISKSGSNYTIEAYLYDDYSELNLQASYTGSMSVVDYSTSSLSTKALNHFVPKARVFEPRKAKTMSKSQVLANKSGLRRNITIKK